MLGRWRTSRPSRVVYIQNRGPFWKKEPAQHILLYHAGCVYASPSAGIRGVRQRGPSGVQIIVSGPVFMTVNLPRFGAFVVHDGLAVLCKIKGQTRDMQEIFCKPFLDGMLLAACALQNVFLHRSGMLAKLQCFRLLNCPIMYSTMTFRQRKRPVPHKHRCCFS